MDLDGDPVITRTLGTFVRTCERCLRPYKVRIVQVVTMGDGGQPQIEGVLKPDPHICPRPKGEHEVVIQPAGHSTIPALYDQAAA